MVDPSKRHRPGARDRQRRLLAAIWALLLTITPAGTAMALDQLDISVTNTSTQTQILIIYDDVCRATVFDGIVNPNSTIYSSICATSEGTGAVTILDTITGARQQYVALLEGAKINLR